MSGVRAFLNHGLPISLSAVVCRSTLHALPYTDQIADVLGTGKLKLTLPLRKGSALEEREFAHYRFKHNHFAKDLWLLAAVVDGAQLQVDSPRSTPTPPTRPA